MSYAPCVRHRCVGMSHGEYVPATVATTTHNLATSALVRVYVYASSSLLLFFRVLLRRLRLSISILLDIALTGAHIPLTVICVCMFDVLRILRP